MHITGARRLLLITGTSAVGSPQRERNRGSREREREIAHLSQHITTVVDNYTARNYARERGEREYTFSLSLFLSRSLSPILVRRRVVYVSISPGLLALLALFLPPSFLRALRLSFSLFTALSLSLRTSCTYTHTHTLVHSAVLQSRTVSCTYTRSFIHPRTHTHTCTHTCRRSGRYRRGLRTAAGKSEEREEGVNNATTRGRE